MQQADAGGVVARVGRHLGFQGPAPARGEDLAELATWCEDPRGAIVRHRRLVDAGIGEVPGLGEQRRRERRVHDEEAVRVDAVP